LELCNGIVTDYHDSWGYYNQVSGEMVTGKTRMVVDYSFNVSLVGIEALKTLSKNTSDIFEIIKYLKGVVKANDGKKKPAQSRPPPGSMMGAGLAHPISGNPILKGYVSGAHPCSEIGLGI